MGRVGNYWRRLRAGSSAGELLGVSIDTTSVCNLRCTICSLDENYGNQGVMTLETFGRLSEDLPSLRQLAFSSSAEPLMNRDLPEMLKRAKGAGIGATSLTTNGTFLDEETARTLISGGLSALEISIDGATKETFEETRVGAKFETVIENVGRLVDLKAELLSATPHVSIRFVLRRQNLHELEAMLDLARSLSVNHVVVNGLEPYTSEMAEETLYGPEIDSELEQRFRALAARGLRLGMRVDLPALTPEPIDDCTLIENSCIVLWDGTVVPCSPLAYDRSVYWQTEPHRHKQRSFGNIHDQSLMEIWRSPEYVEWRRDLVDGVVHEECETCLKRAGVLCPLKHWTWLSTQKRSVGGKIGRTLSAFASSGRH